MPVSPSPEPSPLPAPARLDARSVRHSQRGCRFERGTGTASYIPQDSVPPQVSAAAPLRPRREHVPPLRVVAAAALTTLEAQAIFRLIRSDEPLLPAGEIFRFRRGSRVHRPFLGAGKS